jgi:hypothetical protein
MQADDGFVVVVGPPAKTRLQEEKYHSMIGDIARQFRFLDRLWDEESMKRMLVAQFRADTKDDSDLKTLWDDMGTMEMVPSLDMTGVVMLGWQTRRFPKKLAIAFIEWLYCFGAENKITWTEKYRESAA